MNVNCIRLILLSACSSNKDILKVKEILFQEHIFKEYLNIIKESSNKIKSIYLKFLTDYILFWIFNDTYRRLIFDAFKSNNNFVRKILEMSIIHDDKNLFDEVASKIKLNITPNIIELINDNLSLDIFCNSVYYRNYYNNHVDKITEYYNNDVLLKSIENTDKTHGSVLDLLMNNQNLLNVVCYDKYPRSRWNSADLFKYMEYTSRRQYIETETETETDKSIITGPSTSKYKLHKTYRNLLKYYFNSINVFSSIELHEFLLNQNIMEYIYEYYKFGDAFKKTAHHEYMRKIYKKKNFVKDLLANKYVFYELYEKYPDSIVCYLKLHYNSITKNEINFIMEDIYTESHKIDFYGHISSSFGGKSNKKDKKLIYQSAIKPIINTPKIHTKNMLNFTKKF